MELDIQAIVGQLQESLVEFLARLPIYVMAMLVFLFFLWLAARVAETTKKFVNDHGRSRNAATVIALIIRWGTVVFGALVALSIALPSFKAADLIQVLGISSVAIGFAFRDIFQNFLAGLIILMTDAIKIGDQIIVKDENLEGTVTDIQTRATTISTYDDRKIIIPNAALFTNPVTINTATEKLRTTQIVGISYDSNIDKACALIEEEVKNVDGVLADPSADVVVDNFGESSIDLKVRWWTDARRSNVINVKSIVMRNIKYALDKNGIDIPFPARTLYVRDNELAISR